MSGRSEKFKVRDSKLEPRTQFVFMELGHTSNLDLKPQTPNLKLYLRTQSEFRLSQAWAKSAKKKSRGIPLCKAFFCEGQASLSLEAFSRLWEAWGGHWEVGRCFRRLWGGFGKPYHRRTQKTVNLLPLKQHQQNISVLLQFCFDYFLSRASHIGMLILCANFGYHKLGPNRQTKKIARDPPIQCLFLRRKSSAQSPGSSGQLRKRASWILRPSHTTPACKTRPNPDLEPQALEPTTQTLPSKF